MGGAGTSASGPPGTVTISAETQQLIGVRVAAASKRSVAQPLRVLGRVAAAEDRTYRLIAASDGWVQDDVAPTTGSLVKKGEKLATLYQPRFPHCPAELPPRAPRNTAGFQAGVRESREPA